MGAAMASSRMVNAHHPAPRQAASSTHWPKGSMSPVSSAIGMNAAGGTRPRVGWFQRTSASMPVGRPVMVSTRGW